MADFRIRLKDGRSVKITQNVGDLKAGIRMSDLSRISAYGGPDIGLHTGAGSKTLGRHGGPFFPLELMR